LDEPVSERRRAFFIERMTYGSFQPLVQPTWNLGRKSVILNIAREYCIVLTAFP
jgi:hypothetical protein